MATDDIRVNLELRGERAMTRGLNNVGDAAEDAGDDLRDMGDDAGFLNKQVIATSDNLKKLVTQLDRTGDSSLEKDIRKAERDLRKYQRLVKQLMPDGGDEQAGFIGVQATLQAVRGLATPAGIGLAAAIAPLLGGAVSAAIVGGVGLGGIAGGIALAAKDPAVLEAAKDLGASVSQAWTANGTAFVEPTVDALDQLATTGVKVADKLRPGMDGLATTVDDLAQGVDGFVDGLTDGFVPALKSAQPVVRFLADELPELGQTFGDFIAKVAKDPDGAILALGKLLDITEQAVDGAGNLIYGLSQIYEWGTRAGAATTGALEDIYGWVPLLGDHLRDTNDDLEAQLAALESVKASTDDLTTSTERVTYHTVQLGVAADDAADALTVQREAMSKLVDLELAAVSGTIAYERAIDNLAESRKENGKTLDLETEAGRRNTEQIISAIDVVKENAEREYELAIQHGATAQEAEKVAAAYRDKFGKELREQIVRLFGNTSAVQALLAELDKLNGRRITFTVIQKGGTTLGHQMAGGIQLAGDEPVYRRAGGGSAVAGRTYRVGENGPELLHMGENGYVTNATATKAMVGAAGGVTYLQPIIMIDPASPADVQAMARVIAPGLQLVVIEQGGDVTQVLGAPTR